MVAMSTKIEKQQPLCCVMQSIQRKSGKHLTKTSGGSPLVRSRMDAARGDVYRWESDQRYGGQDFAKTGENHEQSV